MKRIDESLERLFAQHRLVFWYDPDGEWTKAFEEFERGDVTKLTVRDDEFATKVRIHRDQDPTARYLLYFPSARPADADNWLLDLLLQGHEYKADKLSLVLQDLGLPYEFRPVVEQHAKFFDARHVQALRGMLTQDETFETLRLEMMAVLAGGEPDPDELVLAFLGRGPDESLLDPVQECLGAADLTGTFWKDVGTRFGYVSKAPTLRDFAATLFRRADPLDGNAGLDAHSRYFLQHWKDSASLSEAFREWSRLLEGELHIGAQLDTAGDPAALGDADAFEAFDRYIVQWLYEGFERGESGTVLRPIVDGRRGSFWFPDHEDGYEALVHAIDLRESLASAELAVSSMESGVAAYRDHWSRIDAAYRRFRYHQRRYDQVALTEHVADWVEKTYVNNFLLPLADRWGDAVRGLDAWGCAGLPALAEFFTCFVRPFLDRGQKVSVVVSDALRYEAAEELVSRIRAENRWTAELEAVLGALPSYTQLGMAALLPGDARAIEPATAAVTVDGKSSTGTEARRQLLAEALDGRATAVQAETFLEMNTKTDARALLRDHDVVYIFHNVIDKVGDSAATEAKTADAVETALEELLQILRKVANANGSNMLITADHGFLFQQCEVSEDDDLPLPPAGEWLNKNRRWALGRGIAADPTVKVFTAAQLGLEGDWEAAFPLSLGRFPLKGSGKRYVHGGLSLQEVVVPVVRVHKSRADDTERVEVEILRAPAKITTGHLSIALYQVQPAADKALGRTLTVGVYAPDGKVLSEERTVTLDTDEEEPRLRETSVTLALSRAADDYNGQDVEIRLQEAVQGTSQTSVYKSHKARLNRLFESDFDD